MQKTKIITVFFMLLASGIGNLWAALIEIDITAEVTYVDDLCGHLEGQVKIGDIITGSYTYDSDTPDSDPANPNHGGYFYSVPPYGIFLNAGGVVFQTDPDNVDFKIGIGNNTYGEDYYLLRSYNNLPLVNGVLVEHISWQLDDWSGTALSSDALPVGPPVLDDWESNYLLITLGPKGSSSIQGTVTDVWLIPEPGTVLLLGMGMAMLLRRSRSRCR